MACMFIYDAVMVFVTPAFTSNGCSVMLEVATGIDCNSNSIGYPMPPVDATQPEKFPMLMQVMPFDSMTDCMDLAVETSYPMTILGLGDIIIPGYLVTHCFTMAGFSEKIRLLYGIVCVFGGLFCELIGIPAEKSTKGFVLRAKILSSRFHSHLLEVFPTILNV